MVLFRNITVLRKTRKIRPFIYQFAPNSFALGQFFLENQLHHFTCKYVNLRHQTAEMEVHVADATKSPCKALSSSLGFYHTKLHKTKSLHIPDIH